LANYRAFKGDEDALEFAVVGRLRQEGIDLALGV